MGDKLEMDGGKRPRLRRQAKVAMTKRQEKVFFAELAATCNVSHAARVAEVRPQRVYDKRKRDAAFRKAWEHAIAEGYQKLELALLERALVGSEKITVDRKGDETRVREYPNNVALALLKLHREDAREAQRRMSEGEDMAEVEDARNRILERLERLAERQGDGDKTPTGEA